MSAANWQERLLQWLTQHDISQAELARRANRSPQYVNELLRRRASFPPEFAGVLLDIGIDLCWLLAGRPHSEIAETQSAYVGMSVADLAHELGKTLPQLVQPMPHTVWRQAGDGEIDPGDYHAVPVLADPASAGTGRLMSDDVEEYALIHHRVAPHPERIRCIRISGDSMAPTLPDHSIVAVDVTLKDIERAIGRIVCARTESDEVVIKRLWWGEDKKYLALEPEASGFEYERIAVDLAVQPDPLIGVVVWAWIDLRGKEGGP